MLWLYWRVWVSQIGTQEAQLFWIVLNEDVLCFLSSRRALSTLDQTRKDAIIIKEVISETKQKLEVAKDKSADLLKALTNKATSLEKLKAKLGIGSSTITAFTALIDNEIDEDDNDLLYDDEEDELDQEFEKIKNAKMKSRRIKVIEQITSAEGALEDARVQLKKAEQNVSQTFDLNEVVQKTDNE